MSPRGGYEDEKVEGRRMKKYVQMDDPHCEHLGDAEKGSKVNQGQIVHHASWMVCGQNIYFFIVVLSCS